MDRPFAIEPLVSYWGSGEAKHARDCSTRSMLLSIASARHFHLLAQGHKQQEYALGCLISNLRFEIVGPARMPKQS
jgi:hypothetical protein